MTNTESIESSNSPIDDFIESAENMDPKEFRSRLIEFLGLPEEASDMDLTAALIPKENDARIDGVISLPQKRREKNFRRAVQKLLDQSWSDPIKLPKRRIVQEGKVIELRSSRKDEEQHEPS